MDHDHSNHGSHGATTVAGPTANPHAAHMNHDMGGDMGGDGTDGGTDMGHGMMSMSFHTGFTETILFSTWSINSIGGLIGSMIGIFIMAALYEGLKYYREYLFRRTYHSIQYSSVTVPSEKGVVKETHKIVQASMISWFHLFQTCLHVVQIILSYFLMLIFMTYNIWLCMAVVLGAGVGYFCFGWKKTVIVDVTEHCH